MTSRPLDALLDAVLTALLALALAACSALAPEPTPTPTQAPTSTASRTPTASHTPTPSATLTPSQTPTPTYDFLAGTINAAMVSCRFGPGGAYLLRTTLYDGDLVEILGHMQRNPNWLFLHTVKRPDFNCWVSADLVDLHVDPAANLPISDPHLVLPFTTQPYNPLRGVSASRNGKLVTVRWEGFTWLPGDESGQLKYLVEAWVCQNGEYVFRAYGTNSQSIEIQDEPGCSEQSYARAFGSDKHGYTGWVQVPWPH